MLGHVHAFVGQGGSAALGARSACNACHAILRRRLGILLLFRAKGDYRLEVSRYQFS